MIKNYIFWFLMVFISDPNSVVAQQSSIEDQYWSTPKKTFDQRKELFLDYTAKNGVKTGWQGIFRQIVRHELGQELEPEQIQNSLDIIDSKRDCVDFTANGLLRLLYMDKKSEVLSQHDRKNIKNALVEFKYWWDDSRKDPRYRCYHTENHQALYHTAELLAGQYYKNEIFGDGMTGLDHIEHAKERIERWLEFRFRFGFSEWLSISYYEIDILALTNLYDYAEDESLRRKAGIVLDLLLYDMALNNYKSVFGSTHGRVYAPSLIDGKENTSGIFKLIFGIGIFSKEDYIGASCLASSTYRTPQLIQEIATDQSSIIRNKQRVSIEVYDAPKYGLSFESELDSHLFWSMQEFIHPEVVEMSKNMSEKYDTWPYKNYDHYSKLYQCEKELYGKVVNATRDRFALSESNIETYRTPDYMLSTSSDFRPGAMGYQQHIWQATLGRRAIVFTNHPGSESLDVTPNYWAGNARMPKAAQFKNVALVIYNIPEDESLQYSHAYFPKDHFDQVTDSNGWVFGKKGDGYVALFSFQPAIWKIDAKGVENDLLANGHTNFWICEMGSKDQWGSFENFQKNISSAKVSGSGLEINYISPSVGKMEFGWDSPLKVKTQEVLLRYNYRFENPYSKTLFDAESIVIEKGKKKMILNFSEDERTIID